MKIQEFKRNQITNLKTALNNANGKVGVPILMYFLGVPGIICVFIWFFFFKGS